MGTPVGKFHIYICVDKRWTYAGAPALNDDKLVVLLRQYQNQYGAENVLLSPDELNESPQQCSYTQKQSHANIRSAVKQTIDVEKDWAYRSKTMLKDSKWRK